MIEYLAAASLLIGTAFVALSAVGILRLPDVYSRLHAITKASTLGMAGTLLASALFSIASEGYASWNLVRELLAMWFVLLTNPVGGHMIARSAYLIGVRMTELSVVDDLDRAGKHEDVEHDTA